MNIENENDLLEALKDSNPKEGLELINKYEGIIVKKYYDITRYKISFLIKLNKYIDAKVVITNELNVPYVPKDFLEFLNESNKLLDSKFKVVETDSNEEEALEKIDEMDNETLMSIIPFLKKYDLSKYLNQIENILKSKAISNTIKTLFLALLSDKKVNKDFEITKNNQTINVNPITLIDLREMNCFKYTYETIYGLKEIDKNVLDLVCQLVQMYLLDNYPFDLDTDECDILISASLDMSLKMTNSDQISTKFEKIAIINQQKFKEYQEKVNNLIKSI